MRNVWCFLVMNTPTRLRGVREKKRERGREGRGREVLQTKSVWRVLEYFWYNFFIVFFTWNTYENIFKNQQNIWMCYKWFQVKGKELKSRDVIFSVVSTTYKPVQVTSAKPRSLIYNVTKNVLLSFREYV